MGLITLYSLLHQYNCEVYDLKLYQNLYTIQHVHKFTSLSFAIQPHQ